MPLRGHVGLRWRWPQQRPIHEAQVVLRVMLELRVLRQRLQMKVQAVVLLVLHASMYRGRMTWHRHRARRRIVSGLRA